MLECGRGILTWDQRNPLRDRNPLPWGCRMLHSGGDTGNTSWRMSRSLPEALGRLLLPKEFPEWRCVLEKVSQTHFFIIERTTQLDSQIIFARFVKLLLFYFWNLPVPDWVFHIRIKSPRSLYLSDMRGHKTYFHLKLWLKHILFTPSCLLSETELMKTVYYCSITLTYFLLCKKKKIQNFNYR